MDVDAINTQDTIGGYTKEQKNALRTLGLCYSCGQKGHLIKSCPNKSGQVRRALPETLVRPLPKDGHIRTTETQDEQSKDFDPKELLTKDKLHNLIMQLGEEERANIVDVLLDF